MRVKIYGTKYCGFCVAAKDLLERLGIPYEDIDVTGDRKARLALTEMAGGRRTVPVVLIDGEVIGGYVELARMASSGALHLRLEGNQRIADAGLEAGPGPSKLR
jgi:glutaredoxin 3